MPQACGKFLSLNSYKRCVILTKNTVFATDKDMKKLLGIRLKAARTSAAMSQAFVADALRVTRQSIYAWESGSSCPSAIQLGELAALFCADAHALLFGESMRAVSFEPLLIGRGVAR